MHISQISLYSVRTLKYIFPNKYKCSFISFKGLESVNLIIIQLYRSYNNVSHNVLREESHVEKTDSRTIGTSYNIG